MPANAAMAAAQSLASAPSLVHAMRQKPLPDGIPYLLELLAFGPSSLIAPPDAFGTRDPQHLCAIAEAYVQRVMLYPGATPHRVMGVKPGATRAEIRANLRYLMTWLHPDKNSAEWRSVFASRVLEAWRNLADLENGRREALHAEASDGDCEKAQSFPTRRSSPKPIYTESFSESTEDESRGALARDRKSAEPQSIPQRAIQFPFSRPRSERARSQVRVSRSFDTADLRRKARKSRTSPAGWWVKALLGAASIVIALQIGTFALSDLSADTYPDLALRLEDGQPRALVSRAESSLTSDPSDLNGAERDARQALARDPLATRALQRLARVADARGDISGADALFRAVAASTHRDLYTELRLLTEAIDEGDPSSVVARLDHLLRGQNQNLWETILSPLVPVLTQPETTRSLAIVLATNPPWRTWFVHWLARQSNDIDGLQHLAAEMLSTSSPPKFHELGAILGRLLEDGRGEAAHELWIRAQPRELQEQRPLLQHGHFDLAISTPPFDWQFETASNASITSQPDATAPGGTELKVTFNRGNAPFHHVSQLLALQAGGYRLSGAQRAEHLELKNGLIWNVLCAQNSRSIGATSSTSGDLPWTRFDLAFTVPPDCPIQRLQLQGVWHPVDPPARGNAYFADFAITHQQSSVQEQAKPVATPSRASAKGAQAMEKTSSGRELFVVIATALRQRGRNSALEGAREAWTD